jgi:hypothetical protein
MINLSCTYCRAPINLGDGDLARIMQETAGKKVKSAPVTCPTCRHTNKVPMQRLQLAYRQAGSPQVEAAPAKEE